MISTETEHEVRRRATALFETKPDWATFYREVLGVRGIVRRLCRTPEELEAFKRSDSYRDIMAMLRKLLGSKDAAASPDEEPISVVTIRIPRSFHQALRDEAFEYRTSMNKLCISKLLRLIEEDDVESEIDRQARGGGVDL